METTLEVLVALVRKQQQLERDITSLDEQLKAKGKEWRSVSEEDIPNLMLELGVKELKLPSGEKVIVKPEVIVAIPAARRDEAWDWLTDHGFGGLIKTEVTVSYGKGELKKAQQLLTQLVKKKLDTALDRSVHPQTLKAFVKEQLGEGHDVPGILFGITTYSKTTIK